MLVLLALSFLDEISPGNQKRHEANPNPSHGVVSDLVFCVFNFLNPGGLDAPYNA